MEVKRLVGDAELVARRRAQLIEAAITLFSRVGYHAATVKEIADEAGVSAGLLYQYVSDKQDLLFLALRDICQRNKEEIPAALEGIDDALERLFVSIEAYARIVASRQQAVLLTYRETKSLKPEFIHQMKDLELETNALIADCAEAAVATGLLHPTNTELLVYQIIMGAHAWALKSWRLPRIVSLNAYLDQSLHTCWRSRLTQKGEQHAALLASRFGVLRRKLATRRLGTARKGASPIPATRVKSARRK